VLHAYAARFDVTRNLKNFLDFGGIRAGLVIFILDLTHHLKVYIKAQIDKPGLV